MKKIIFIAIAISTLYACKPTAPTPVNNVAQMFITNGWRPVGITVDTTDNGINDQIDIWDACNIDNKGIFLQNGTAQYFIGATTCDVADTNQIDTWWWDANALGTNTNFYYKEPTETNAQAKYCTILKLSSDSFNYSGLEPRIMVGGVLSPYIKFYFKTVPF